MVWVFVVLFICALLIAIYYYSIAAEEQQKNASYVKEKENFLTDLGKYQQQTNILNEKNIKLSELENEIKQYQEKLSELQKQITAFEKDKEHLQKEKEQLEQIQKDLISNSTLKFKEIAADILKNTKDELTTTNKEELKNVVEPFEKNIKSFETTIQNQTKEFSQTKGSLENELKNIINQGNQLKEQTTNLIDMFKTDSKAKGDFGETILQTILENSNLQEGVNYFVQQQKDNKRPDFQILLPGNKWIVIDSKVPLTAYINYCNAKTEEDKNRYLDEHIDAINGFIKNLSSKKYTEKFMDNGKNISPDFTLMFIYPEEAYISALRYKPSLTNEAWKKEIAIVSATSLIHTIRIIEKLWDVQRQVENHEQIVDKALSLKKKLITFIKYISNLGTSIQKVGDNYNELQSNIIGKGGLTKLVDELADYGIDSNNKLETDNIKEIKNIENKLTENK